MSPDFTEARWWQLYEKCPRPALRWLSLAAFVWVAGGCDLAGNPMESAARGVILAFIAALYGLRGVEQMKGAS